MKSSVFKFAFWFFLSVFLVFASVLSVAGEIQTGPDKIVESTIKIKDINGTLLQPFQPDNSHGSVLFFVTHDCPISNAYSPELVRIRKEFGKNGFKLFLVYVDSDVTSGEIKKHVKDYSLEGFTAIHDRNHVLVKQTGAEITPEVVIVLPDAAIAYKGRIDNMYPALGKRRRTITKHELRDALKAILENRPIEVTRTKAIGCFIPNT